MAADQKPQRNVAWRLILAALILYHLALNLFVLRHMDYPPATYPHFTHHAVLMKAETWDEERISSDALWASNRDLDVMISAAALTVRLLGPSYLSICLISSMALAALLIGAYALGALLRSERAGLVAAALLSSFPAIWGLSRLFEEQVADAAFAVWTVYIAMRLARRPGPLWAALLAGMFLLDYLWPKEITYLAFQILFIGPAVAVALLAPGLDDAGPLRRRAAWAVAAALVAAVLCYGPMLDEVRLSLSSMRGYYSGEAFANPEYENTSLWSHPANALLYYLYAILASHVGPYGVIFMAATIPFAFLGKRTAGRAAVAAWIAVPWIALTLVRKKQDMYAIGFLPPLAVLSAIGWDLMPGKAWRGRLTALALAGLTALGLYRTLAPTSGITGLKVMLRLNIDRYDWRMEPTKEGQLYDHIGELIAARARELYPEKKRIAVGLAKYPSYDFSSISYCAAVRDTRLLVYRMVDDDAKKLDVGRPMDLVVTFWPSDIQVAAGFWPRAAYDEYPVPPHLMPDELAAALGAAGYAPAGRAGPCRFFAPAGVSAF